MTDLLGTLASLLASLGNAQSVGVVRERLALVQDQLALVHQETVTLRAENQRLAQQLDRAKAQLSAHVRTQQFVEQRGALFKPDPAGGYQRVVYCPKCQHSTSAFPPGETFVCDECQWFSSFTENQLATVLDELSG